PAARPTLEARRIGVYPGGSARCRSEGSQNGGRFAMTSATMGTSTHAKYPFPAAVVPYDGAILDLDAHESSPANLWAEIFGSAVKPFADACLRSNMVATNVVRERDETPITADMVWSQKLEQAPGAFDLDRRLE